MRPYKPPVTVCKKIKCIDCRRNIVLMGIVKNFQEHGWRVRAARSLFVTFWGFFLVVMGYRLHVCWIHL